MVLSFYGVLEKEYEKREMRIVYVGIFQIIKRTEFQIRLLQFGALMTVMDVDVSSCQHAPYSVRTEVSPPYFI